MTKGIEIQTVHQNTRDYIKKYRDIPKFLQFCKACPRYNRCWACPEHGFDTEQYIAAYSHVYIIGAKIPVPASLRQIDMSSEQIAQAAEGITKAARRILDPVLLLISDLCHAIDRLVMCKSLKLELFDQSIAREGRKFQV